MALDVSEIRLAPQGHVYIAPSASAVLPTDVTSAIDTGFAELGYLSDDGVAITPSVDTTDIKAWQSATPVKTVLTSVAVNVKISMLQVTQDGTAEYFFGSQWSNVTGIGKLSLSSNPDLAERAMVIEWTDDESFVNRLVFGRGILTDREAMNLQRTTNTAFGVTFEVLDLDGELGYWLTSNTDLIPAT